MLVYGCMGVGFNFSLVVWASIFPCTMVSWKAFCVCVAVGTGVVGVKWRQEATVRYHAQEGPAGTPRDDVHSHKSSAGFDTSQSTAGVVKGPYTGRPLYNHGTVVPRIANCRTVNFLQSTLAPIYLVKYWYVKEQLGNSIV